MGKKAEKKDNKFEYFGGKELIAGALAFVALLLFCACSEKIVYKEVLIPTKCDIKERKQPRFSGEFLTDFKNVLVYSEGLKKDVDFCRGVK